MQNPLTSLGDDVAAAKRAIARKINAKTLTLKASHVPMLSQPTQVAALAQQWIA